MDAMKKAGCTMEEIIEAVDRLAKMMKPLDESDIERIRLNPSLSRFQKWKLTREVRRAIRKQKKSPNVWRFGGRHGKE